MPSFSRPNRDLNSIDISQATPGPRVGFMESFSIAYEEQQRTGSQLAVEKAFWDQDDAQYRAGKKAGIEDMPKLAPKATSYFTSFLPAPIFDGGVYGNTADFYTEGGDGAQASSLASYDAKIAELQKQFPDLNLRDSRGMFTNVVEKARKAEKAYEESRSTFGGKVGSFFGSTAASLDPHTDPFNFATLPVGGAGKTVGARVAAQFGIQGGIETINQVTGVQANREKLGLSHGLTDAATRVIGTAVGGAAVQGLGEAAAKTGKRWFRNADTDPAPLAPAEPPKSAEFKPLADPPTPHTEFNDVMHPRSPMSNTRMGQSRTVLDVDYVASRLEEWGGDDPFNIRLRAETAIPTRVSEVHAEVKVEGLDSNVDRLARDVDPGLFNKYDALVERAETFRRWLDQASDVKIDQNPVIKRIDAKIEELEVRIENPNTNTRVRKKAERDRSLLRTEREAKSRGLTEGDDPTTAQIREELLKNDYKRRDLAPLVSRAYARARGQWALGAEDRALVNRMIKDSKANLPKTPLDGVRYEDVAPELPKTLIDKAPTLREAQKVQDELPPNASAADTAKAIMAKNAKVMDDAYEGFRTDIDATLEGNKISVPGLDRKMDLDNDFVTVPQLEGEGTRSITVRQLLEEQREADADIEAINVCSIN